MSIRGIRIDFIDHESQDYATVGNWKFIPNEDDPHLLHISVSTLGNTEMETCVAVHEIVEALLCLKHKIPDVTVTAFDKTFESLRPRGDTSEPGDDPMAPYHAQHVIASGVEEVVADALGVKWQEYADAIEAL